VQHVYKGKQKDLGRKRVCDGKMDVSNPDRRRLRLIRSNKEKDVFAAVVYSVLLHQKVLAAFIYDKDEKTGNTKPIRKRK
jgi:hypothetical protein